MRVLTNAALQIGQVVVPVGVAIAQSRSDAEISYRLLHRACGEPIRQPRECTPCKKRSLGNEDVVKGWEFSRGQFVLVEDEELAAFDTRRILLTHTTALEEIEPWFLDRTYWLQPGRDVHAQRPYALLAQVLAGEGLVAVGKAVLWGKETPACVQPTGDGVLALTLLMFAEAVRSRSEAVERLEGVELRTREVQLARKLVRALRQPFDPDAFENETAAGIRGFLEAKVKGRKRRRAPVLVQTPEAATLDLAAALRASLPASRETAAAR